MTRINLIPVEDLNSRMLCAEYREITRLPNNLRKSMLRKKPFDYSEIPPNYVLGQGHVKFFYNKFLFLKKRFESLVQEMIDRGYNPKFTDSSIFDIEYPELVNDYTPSTEEINTNIQRINERLNGMGIIYANN